MRELEIRVATAGDLIQAEEIHFECLAGNNDNGKGRRWSPAHRTPGATFEVVLVAAESHVLGYVFGDETTNSIAVCQEIAVTASERGRGLVRPLLGAFVGHSIAQWSSEWIYLQPLEPPWLADLYRRLCFVDAPDEPGCLRAPTQELARRL